MYYTYQDARGHWRLPAKGVSEKDLVSCYRNVRKIATRGQNKVPVSIWTDGQLAYPLHPEEVACRLAAMK